MQKMISFTMVLALLLGEADAQILVVSLNGEAQTALVDPNTYEVLATLPTNPGPHEITISPDGRYAYTAITGMAPDGVKGNSITVFDLETRVVQATFGACLQPHDTRLSRDGTLLWVACAPARTVLEMDAHSGAILKTWETEQEGGWFVEVTPDERKLYVPHLEGQGLSIIDRTVGEMRTIPMSSAQLGIAITPDGREVWVSGNQLSVLDVASDSVITSFPGNSEAGGRIQFTPDGSKLVLHSGKSGTSQIYVVHIDVSGLTQLTHNANE